MLVAAPGDRGDVPPAVFTKARRLWPYFLPLGVSLMRHISLWWFVLSLRRRGVLSTAAAKLAELFLGDGSSLAGD